MFISLQRQLQNNSEEFKFELKRGNEESRAGFKAELEKNKEELKEKLTAKLVETNSRVETLEARLKQSRNTKL